MKRPDRPGAPTRLPQPAQAQPERRASKRLSTDGREPVAKIGRSARPPQGQSPERQQKLERLQRPERVRRPVRQRDETAEARHALREARKARKAFERNEVRRFTARVRRRRLTVTAVVASFIAVIAFVIAGVYSPVMRITTISVDGTTRVDPLAISSQLADQIGQPLPLVNVGRIEEVLRRQTLVESYSIESRPPNSLIIHVVERQPVAFIPVGTAFELKDAAGVTIETAPELGEGYPVLHVPNDEPKGTAFDAAIAVIRSLPADLRERLSDVSATTADDVTFVLGDTNQRVFWGSSEDAAIKVRSLTGLMANWPPGTANEYDVSSSDNVVVR